MVRIAPLLSPASHMSRVYRVYIATIWRLYRALLKRRDIYRTYGLYKVHTVLSPLGIHSGHIKLLS
jgi:hypothetical protein